LHTSNKYLLCGCKYNSSFDVAWILDLKNKCGLDEEIVQTIMGMKNYHDQK
jgi:hypothetical protein